MSVEKEGMSDDNIETLLCACGFSAITHQINNHWQIVCVRCERRGPTADTVWLAAKLWNNDRKGVTVTTTTKEREG
jgi:hypothetical protein